jgi:hypothetical protein
VGIAVIDEFALADSASLPFSVVRIKGGPRIHIYLSWKRKIVRSHFFKKFEGRSGKEPSKIPASGAPKL